MDDALLVGGFERFGNLLRDGECFIDWDRPARNALRQILALDQLHDQGTHAAGLLKPVDVRDVRMIE